MTAKTFVVMVEFVIPDVIDPESFEAEYQNNPKRCFDVVFGKDDLYGYCSEANIKNIEVEE